MRYTLEFRPKARRDIGRLSPEVSRRVEQKLDLLCQDLNGDVKRLVNFTPGWRLRVGDWRVLFQPEGATGCVSNRPPFRSVRVKGKPMTKFKSQLWTNEKGKRFIVLPEKDFLRLSELIEDRGLSRILREAIASDTNEPSIPFEQVKRELAAARRPKKRKA